MTKDLYLVRHGQTLFNRKKMISGWTDSPLTELGLEQARRAGAFCASVASFSITPTPRRLRARM